MVDPISPPVIPPVIPPVPAVKPWYDGKADPETVGHWQNRNLADKDPATVALEMTKAHREAEKLIGVPANKLIRLPDSLTDDAAWSKVWQGLGAPPDATGYDFSAVKRADGNPLAPALVDQLRAASAAAHLPKDAAVQVAASVAKYLDGSVAERTADQTAKVALEKDALAKNWGPNQEVNKFVASQAAQKLGFTSEMVAALEGVAGYAKVMEAFRVVGVTMGEDRFVQGSGQTKGGVMTVEQAQARVAELKTDGAWRERYFKGGAAEAREMTALMNIIVP